MILGINASGRRAVRNGQDILVKGVSEDILKHILNETGEPHEYVHLGGKTIRGCQGASDAPPTTSAKKKTTGRR